jgi:hypothetical protein
VRSLNDAGVCRCARKDSALGRSASYAAAGTVQLPGPVAYDHPPLLEFASASLVGHSVACGAAGDAVTLEYLALGTGARLLTTDTAGADSTNVTARTADLDQPAGA